MKKQAKDYTVYTVTGKAARWKREIIVNKGKVWVPGTRENLMRAMFSGWPILTVEGKPRIRIDDLISSGDFSGGRSTTGRWYCAKDCAGARQRLARLHVLTLPAVRPKGRLSNSSNDDA